MTSTDTPVSTVVMFSAAELDLLADAFASLFFRRPERRAELMDFARQHPELDLLYKGRQPIAEEDR